MTGRADHLLAGPRGRRLGPCDATWWLTDVLSGPGEPTDWHRAQDELPRRKPLG